MRPRPPGARRRLRKRLLHRQGLTRTARPSLLGDHGYAHAGVGPCGSGAGPRARARVPPRPAPSQGRAHGLSRHPRGSVRRFAGGHAAGIMDPSRGVFTSGGVKGVTARTDNSGPRLRPSPAPAGTDIAKHHPVCGYRHAKALDCHPCPSRQGTAKGTNPSKKLGNMAHWPGGHASPARGTDERYGLSARHLVAGSKKVDACGSAVLAFPYRGASGRPPTRSGDEEGHSLIQPILGVSPDPSHRTRPPPGSHLLS